MIVARLIKGFMKLFDNGNSNVVVTSNNFILKRYKYAIHQNFPFRKNECYRVLKGHNLMDYLSRNKIYP